MKARLQDEMNHNFNYAQQLREKEEQYERHVHTTGEYTTTHILTRANGLKSYGDMIIIYTYIHTQASGRVHSHALT